ncbi:MAG: protease modulator HflK [Gemmataceae bacterium]|nr:protease modulator HflK [Gemmataceae bacterium]
MRWLILLVGLFLVGWFLTGVTQIRPGERAVVRRFGKVVAQPGPGLRIGWPWGIETVDRVAVDEVRRVSVGYQPEGEDSSGATPIGQLLTGDHNLVNAGVQVHYAVQPDRIDDFVVQQDRVNGLVARSAEAALAEWVAGRKVDEVLLTGKSVLPEWLAEQTQQRIDAYRLGVRIQAVSVALLLPPDEVRSAFDEVTRAQTAIETQKNGAREQADRIRREAEAKRFSEEQKTAGYVKERLTLAQTEANAFENRLAQYQRLKKQNPDILASIWWDEMSKVFERLNKNGRIDLLDSHLGPDGLDITMFGPQPRKK